MQGDGFKNTMNKVFKGSQLAWNNFLKPAINATAPVIGMSIEAKSKNPQVAQATTNLSQSVVERFYHLQTCMEMD